ncbi:MAG: hypothetical protein QXZ70_03555 [Candidatus Bathyarchaeia archaeon]
MYQNNIQYVDIVVTKHAIKRIRERGGNLEEIISYLRHSKSLLLLKNCKGYEILIPLKGKLVGHFDGKALIIKSFLWFFKGNSRFEVAIRVSSVNLPKAWAFGNTVG